MNRAERRRQLKEDEKRIGLGFDARQDAGRQVIALMRLLGQKLQVSIQRRSVNPLMEFVYANLSSGSRLLGDVPIACGRGCSHCCHSWVDAGPAEVLFAAKSMLADQRQRAMKSVDIACQATGGRSFDQRAAMVTPCPLLQDHACSAYEARPIVCRSAVSADADACRRAYLEMSGEGVPIPTLWRVLGQGYAVALEGAILNAGLVPTAREWNESLRLALTEPEAESRWLAGEDVFARLPRASTSGSFENAAWRDLYSEAFGGSPPA